MRLFIWTISALVFGIAGLQSVGAMCVAVVFMCGGVYELQRRENERNGDE